MTWKDIPGHFNFSKFYDELLDRWTEPRGYQFAEVGVYLGRSVAYLASEAKRRGISLDVYAIDLWPDVMFDQFWPSMVTLGLDTCVRPLRGISWEMARPFGPRSFDAVFIDAAHDRESVTKDSTAWLPKVKPGGVIAGHDIKHIPVRQAVTAVFGTAWTERHKCWVVEVQDGKAQPSPDRR